MFRHIADYSLVNKALDLSYFINPDLITGSRSCLYLRVAKNTAHLALIAVALISSTSFRPVCDLGH